MKKKIAGIVMTLSFILLAGFIGGLDRDTLTVTQGIAGSAVSLTIFFVSAWKGGIIE